MFCNKCGNQIADDVKFCVKCGQPVGQAVQNGNAPAPQPQNAAQGSVPQGTVIVQNSGGGVFQKVMLVFICIIFLVIMFVVVSFYMENKKDKDIQQQQMNLAAQAQADREQLMLHYESYQGSWEIESAYIDGEWKSYNSFGEIAGAILDWRNLYYYGNDTNYGAATTIEFTSNSIDMTNVGLGVYSLDYFVYSQTMYGEDVFTNETQGIKIQWKNSSPKSYLLISELNSNGEWVGICTCQKA